MFQVAGRILFPGAAMFEIAAATSKLLISQQEDSAQAASVGITLSSALDLPAPIESSPITLLLECTADPLTGRLELASSQQGVPSMHKKRALHMSAEAVMMSINAAPKLDIGSSFVGVLEVFKAARVYMPVFLASIAGGSSLAAAASESFLVSAAQVDSSLQLGAVAPALRGESPAALAVPVGAAGYIIGTAQLQYAIAAALPSLREHHGKFSCYSSHETLRRISVEIQGCKVFQ